MFQLRDMPLTAKQLDDLKPESLEKLSSIKVNLLAEKYMKFCAEYRVSQKKVYTLIEP